MNGPDNYRVAVVQVSAYGGSDDAMKDVARLINFYRAIGEKFNLDK